MLNSDCGAKSNAARSMYFQRLFWHVLIPEWCTRALPLVLPTSDASMNISIWCIKTCCVSFVLKINVDIRRVRVQTPGNPGTSLSPSIPLVPGLLWRVLTSAVRLDFVLVERTTTFPASSVSWATGEFTNEGRNSPNPWTMLPMMRTRDRRTTEITTTVVAVATWPGVLWLQKICCLWSFCGTRRSIDMACGLQPS